MNIFSFFCFRSDLFAVEFDDVGKNDDFRRITINDNFGHEYIYAVNLTSSHFILFKKDGKDFSYIADDIDYSMDGLYFIKNAKSETNKLLSIMTVFHGAGGQKKKYFIDILNGFPHIAGIVTFNFNYNQNPDLQQHCIQTEDDNSEVCEVEKVYEEYSTYEKAKFFGKALINAKQNLYKKPDKNSVSKAYLIHGDEVIVFDKRSSEETIWCHIGYKGKKDVFAWMPCSALQMMNAF